MFMLPLAISTVESQVVARIAWATRIGNQRIAAYLTTIELISMACVAAMPPHIFLLL